MPYIGKSPSVGVRNRFVYQATAGQTSFSGSDQDAKVLTYQDSLYMDVYQNGVLLKPGTDYTATTGTTMVLVTGASLNDVVEMVIYDTFSVANSYTKAEADTRYPFKGNNSIIRLNGQTITQTLRLTAMRMAYQVGLSHRTMPPSLLMDIGVSYDQRIECRYYCGKGRYVTC